MVGADSQERHALCLGKDRAPFVCRLRPALGGTRSVGGDSNLRADTRRHRGEDSSASLGSQRISIDGSGVSIESDHFSSRMDWDMIRKVDCTKDHIFAFTGPLNAIIVPRRSLQGASFEQVLGALVRRGAT